MQIKQRISNCTDMQIMHNSRQNSETDDILHAFLSLVVAKLSDLKTVLFLVHPIHTVKLIHRTMIVGRRQVTVRFMN